MTENEHNFKFELGQVVHYFRDGELCQAPILTRFYVENLYKEELGNDLWDSKFHHLGKDGNKYITRNAMYTEEYFFETYEEASQFGEKILSIHCDCITSAIQSSVINKCVSQVTLSSKENEPRYLCVGHRLLELPITSEERERIEYFFRRSDNPYSFSSIVLNEETNIWNVSGKHNSVTWEIEILFMY